jgi:hypothetical protein
VSGERGLLRIVGRRIREPASLFAETVMPAFAG